MTPDLNANVKSVAPPNNSPARSDYSETLNYPIYKMIYRYNFPFGVFLAMIYKVIIHFARQLRKVWIGRLAEKFIYLNLMGFVCTTVFEQF